MKTLFTFFLLTISLSSLALPAGTKAEDGAFKVSDKSLAHMGIQFQTLNGKGPWKVPKEAIVNIKLTKGVYRRYEGEIVFIVLTKSQALGTDVLIASDDLEAGDEVAIKGADFLRMTETDLNSETVDNCAH